MFPSLREQTFNMDSLDGANTGSRADGSTYDVGQLPILTSVAGSEEPAERTVMLPPIPTDRPQNRP
jgi:hypothetical protein